MNKLEQFLIKQANPYLRTNAAKAKDYNPGPVKNKPKQTVITMGEWVQRPSSLKSNMVVANGQNKNVDPHKGSLYPFLQPWNTISGTGFGNRYWAEPQNPLQL